MNMKAAATLTGSLLARKGAAYPASYSAPTPSPDDGDNSAPAERAYNDPRVIASAPPPPPTAEPAAPPPVDDGPQMQDGRFVEDVAPTDHGSDTPMDQGSDTPMDQGSDTPTDQGSSPAPLQEPRSGHKEPILSAPEPEPVEESVSAPEPAPVEEPVSAPEPAPVEEAPAPRPAVGAPQATEEPGLPQSMDHMGRVRLSVRLDPDRYLRVKMASARTRWSAQDIVIAALDKYLGNNAEKGAGNGNGAAPGQSDEDAG